MYSRERACRVSGGGAGAGEGGTAGEGQALLAECGA